MPNRRVILNDGRHVPNVHRYQVFHSNFKSLQYANGGQSSANFRVRRIDTPYIRLYSKA